MNKTKTLVLALAALATSSIASAIGIVGDIHISANDPANVDLDANTVTFANPGVNAHVSYANSDYASFDGADVEYFNFSYDPLSTSDAGGKIWSLDATTYFVLKSISYVNEYTSGPFAGVKVFGSGIAYMAGYEATYGSWSFSADSSDSGSTFNWSSTASVPDSGSTVALLGLATLAIAAVSRRKRS